MKKMLKAVAAAMAVTAMMCVNAYAANENYLKEEWNDGIETVVEKKTEGGDTVYRATNVINPYSSPVIPVLAAVKKAYNSGADAVALTFEIRAVYKNGEDLQSSAKLLLRGAASDGALARDFDAWNKKYEEACGDNDVPFVNKSGNIMYHAPNGFNFSGEWTTVEWTIEFPKEIVNIGMLSEWNLCMDGISECADIEAIEVKNAAVYNFEDYEPAEETTPVPEGPKDDATPTPTMKNVFGEATPTTTAEATATVEATEVPTETKGGNSLWWVWGIAAVVVVGGAVAVCVVINKKKKTDK